MTWFFSLELSPSRRTNSAFILDVVVCRPVLFAQASLSDKLKTLAPWSRVYTGARLCSTFLIQNAQINIGVPIYCWFVHHNSGIRKAMNTRLFWAWARALVLCSFNLNDVNAESLSSDDGVINCRAKGKTPWENPSVAKSISVKYTNYICNI